MGDPLFKDHRATTAVVAALLVAAAATGGVAAAAPGEVANASDLGAPAEDGRTDHVAAGRGTADRVPELCLEEPLPGVGNPAPCGRRYGPRHRYGSRRMDRGDRGTDVAKLQSYLTRLGLRTRVDGRYGRQTSRRVHQWEAWRYRPSDSRVSRGEAAKIRRQVRNGARYERRSHVFPVRGPHSYGGSGSRYGASRGDHAHQGQDVAAAHGTDLAAVHAGRVSARQYQAGGAGHYLVSRDATARTPSTCTCRVVRSSGQATAFWPER